MSGAVGPPGWAAAGRSRPPDSRADTGCRPASRGSATQLRRRQTPATVRRRTPHTSNTHPTHAARTNTQTRTHTTRKPPTPTLLDLVITNLTSSPTSVTVLSEPIADRQPVLLTAEVRRQRPPWPTPVTRRRWEHVDWDAICLSFLTSDWGPRALQCRNCRREADGVRDNMGSSGRRAASTL